MISHLHIITGQQQRDDILPFIENACKSGANWIQLRMKKAGRNEILEQAIPALKICRNYKTKLIINDRADIAAEIDADGVHLGKEDMPIADARRILGGSKFIGATANTLEDMLIAARSGADYIGLGPFRFTTTKEKLSPVLGIEGYRELMQDFRKGHTAFPVIAIGGIHVEDIPDLMRTGIHGVAVSSALNNHSQLRENIEQFNNLLKENYDA